MYKIDIFPKMLLMLFLIFTFSSSNADQTVPVCKSVTQSGDFSKVSDSVSIASFSFDMSVTFNSNPSLPNILMITNISFFETNFTLENLSFTFFGNRHKIISCPSLSSNNCIFEFPNGEIIYILAYNYNTYPKIAIGPNLYVNDGTFYDGKTSELWNPTTNLTCINNNSTYDDLYFWYSSCCTSFEDIQISDSNDGTCQNFETKSTISDPSSSTNPITIQAQYFVSTNNSLQIDISLLSSPDPEFIYYAYVGYPFVSYINGSSATRNTSFTLNLADEKQYEILFDYNPSASDAGDGIFKFGGVSLGEIIVRNGMFLKNINQPYTPSNPCWIKVATVPFTNATYNSSFCCTNFLQSSTTLSTTLTTITSNETNNLIINFYVLLVTVVMAMNFYL